MLIGTTPGGGYDIYARALRGISAVTCRAARRYREERARRRRAHARQLMYNRAPADGSELATVQNGLPFEKLFQTLSPDGRNALFDATKFGWIGSITQSGS